MKPYRILSLDGGGVRGLYAAVLLKRLRKGIPGFLDGVDLFAGTSTGGIIALGLAKGLVPDHLIRLYRDDAQKIFDDSWIDDLKDLGGLTGADYDNTNLRNILAEIFGKAKLKSLKRRVLIPAFDLDNHGEYGQARMWAPKFFHNFPGPDSDGEELVLDVAMRTSAAPTYFPTYGRYIDGGVVENNPSMAAVAQAIDAGTGKQRLENLRLLSLGTGFNPTHIDGENLDWGIAQWARPLLHLMIEGVMGVADYECKRLLGARYHRLCPALPEVVLLDAANKTEDLVRCAEAADLSETVKWLQENF